MEDHSVFPMLLLYPALHMRSPQPRIQLAHEGYNNVIISDVKTALQRRFDVIMKFIMSFVCWNELSVWIECFNLIHFHCCYIFFFTLIFIFITTLFFFFINHDYHPCKHVCICHNVPGPGRNKPDASSIGSILVRFWHVLDMHRYTITVT